MLSHYEMILRIATAAVLGGIIGFERDIHGRPVGLRTHLIVALAAGTYMVLSAHFAYYQGYGPDKIVDIDASRIAASVVSGIGFLAGGSILKTGFTVQGVTTAAGLWLVTAIGLCAGAGMTVEALAATGMGLAALTILRRFEDKNDRIHQRHLTVELNQGGAELIQEFQTALEAIGAVGSNYTYEKKLAEGVTIIDFEVSYHANLRNHELVAPFERRADLRRIRVSGPHRETTF